MSKITNNSVSLSTVIMTGVAVNINRSEVYPFGDVVRVHMSYKGCEVEEIIQTPDWDKAKSCVIDKCYFKIMRFFKEDLL